MRYRSLLLLPILACDPTDEAPVASDTGALLPANELAPPAWVRCNRTLPNATVQAVERAHQQQGVFQQGAIPGSVTIPVHVHVVTRGAGLQNGEVTSRMLADQIAVLNAAYGQAGFVFTQVSLDTTVNPVWFNECTSAGTSSQMRAALHMGGPGELNLYTCNPSGGLLGWSSYPWEYASNPTDDGVIILFEALPGGAAAPMGPRIGKLRRIQDHFCPIARSSAWTLGSPAHS